MPKTFKGYVPIEKPSFMLESPNGSKLEVRCKPFLPGSRFLDFLSKIKENDPAAMAGGVYNLLEAAVEADQWEEFKAFIDDPENGIGLDILAEIGGYLGEIYPNRPTEPSARS